MNVALESKGIVDALAIVSLVGLLVAITGCSEPAALAIQDAPDANVVKVGFSRIASPIYAAMFIADSRGYFKEQGIRPDFVEFSGSSQDMMAPLSAGELDVAQGVPGPGTFNALAEYEHHVVAGGGRVGEGGNGSNIAFLARKDLYDAGVVRSVGDLKGKTVNFAAVGAPIDYLGHAMLAKAGLSESDVNVVYLVTVYNGVAALEQKRIDATGVVEPYAADAEEKGYGVRLVESDDILAPGTQVDFLVFAQSFATERAGVAEKFAVAYLKGLRDWRVEILRREIPAETAEIISKWTGLTPETVRQLHFDVPDANGRVNVLSLKEQQEFWVKRGLLPKTAPIEKRVDERFMDYAVGLLGAW